MTHPAPPPSALRTWRPMRPWIDCPYCHRRGAVQRRMGVKSFVRHHCPGPFVLDHVEEDSNDAVAGYRVIVYPAGPPVCFDGGQAESGVKPSGEDVP